MRTLPLLLLSGLVVGCLSDPDDLAETETTLTATNKLGANKLGANKLGANKLGANKLSASALASNALLDSADGREVLSFVISCALPTGTTLSVTARNGAVYQFAGSIGLAPAWATRLPTVSERRWVTACLLARTNLYGVQVDISLRHDTNVVLTTTSAERGGFTIVEGAFYGDLFAASPVWYACGLSPWTAAGAGTFRACARSQNGVTTDCGFVYTGNCATGPACTDKTAPFRGCSGYAEVITIYLKP